MVIITRGIDLAKTVFAMQGVDESDNPASVYPTVERQLLEVIAKLPSYLICIKAGCAAHHRARAFARFGHTSRAMVLKFVASYRSSGKERTTHAQAICETVSRSIIRYADGSQGIMDDIFAG